MDSAFFLVSKIGWLIVQPLSIVALLILLAILTGLAGWRRLAAGSAALSLFLLWLAAFTTLGELAVRHLETRYPVAPALPSGPVSAILVLGGGFDVGVAEGPSGVSLGPGSDRLVEAFILARQHPNAMVIVTGGDGTLSGGKLGDGVLAPRIYGALGLAPERLRTETMSRTTAEHPELVRPILQARLQTDPGTVLLVTSGFHMPRAKAVFDKAGIETLAWPVDLRAREDPPLSLLEGTPVVSLALTSIAVREWLGIIAYRLSGRL